jgi:putative phage-type endonuclease
MGVDPHRSPYLLFHEKVGLVEREDIDPKYSIWGHVLEVPIRAHLQREHDELDIMEVPGTYRNPKFPFILANVDGIAFDMETGELDSVVECKTSENGYGWGPAHSRDLADIPEKYRWQVLTYMTVLGIEKARICALLNTVNYREYVVYFDKAKSAALLERMEAFWEQVQKREVPPIDGWESTVKLIRSFNPSLDKKLEVDIPEKIADSWLEAKANLEKAESEKYRWDGHMLAHMGTAYKGNYKGKPIVGRQAKGDGIPFLVAK